MVVGLGIVLRFDAAPPTLQAQDSPSDTPTVIRTDPTEFEELPLNGTVRFYFDRAMNPDTGIYAIAPSLDDGEWSWEDGNATLLYTPSEQGYEASTAYTFTIFAQSTNNVPMAENFTVTLISASYLEVIQVVPAPDSSNISIDASITVVFNRPVVPLVSIGDQENLPNPLTITPETPGSGSWINTSVFMFIPETTLIGGETYTVTIQADLEAVNNARMAKDFVFQFFTVQATYNNVRILNPPYVRRDINPNNDPAYEDRKSKFDIWSIPLNPEIEVSFTQPMDVNTEKGLFLETQEGERVLTKYEWQDDSRTVKLIVEKPLELNTLYDLVGDEDVLRSATGGKLSNGYRRSLLTVPYPDIYSTSPEDGDDNVTPSISGFTVYFNVPINLETVEGKVTIIPEPENELRGFYYDVRSWYSWTFETLPDTEYTITIAPGIEDVYGNAIKDGVEFTFRTRNYEPVLRLNVPSLVGLYNAYADSTHVFVNHRNIETIEMGLYQLDLNALANISKNNWTGYTPESSAHLRVWQVPASAPTNISREKLLLVSDVDPIVGNEDWQCAGVPARRLSLFAEARTVMDDPRPLIVYSDPTMQGDVITQYAPGTVFWVQDGPICADGFLWWEVENFEDETRGWIPEGTFNGYFVEPLSDETQLDNGYYTKLPPGAYFLSVNSPQINTRSQFYNVHTLIVATDNITLKYSNEEALAWVTNMQTGEPSEGLYVRFYDSDFNFIGYGITDKDGLATIKTEGYTNLSGMFAVTETGDHFGFVSSAFEYGIRTYQFGLPTDFYNIDGADAYLYTDRPIYRPDQTVYFRGIIRQEDDVFFTLPDRESVQIEIYDSTGKTVYEERLSLNGFGSFSGEFALDAEASLGNYRVTVVPDGVDRDRYYYWNYPSVTFSVAEYRAPEFQVVVTPTEDEVVQGDDIEVAIQSSYFFGGGVSNARVSYTVLGRDHYFDYQGTGYWSFTDYNYDTGEGGEEVIATTQGNMERIASGNAVTDDSGQFLLELPASLGENATSQVYTIEGVVVDESNQEVAGRTTVIVHQGLVYIGLSPEQYISYANRPTQFNVISVDWDSQFVPNQELEYRVVERRWYSVQEKDVDGRAVWSWEVEEIDITSGTTSTNDLGKSTIEFTPPNGGVFKVYAETIDSLGNKVISSDFMWVAGPDYVPWRQRNDNRIELIPNTDNYKVGDVAEILIPSPFQGETLALITVERDRFLHTEVIRMETNSYVYQLPIEQVYAPNVFVSVVLLKGEDETNPHAEFRLGITQLTIDTEPLAMNVEITPVLPEGLDLAQPGDEVTVKVKTSDWQGNPVSAEVGIGVTDLAVLSLVPPNSRPLMEHYYSQRALSVRTSTTLTISTDDYIQFIINGRKGGGGGGGGDFGVIEVRQDFVDTPLWTPSVITNDDGEAEVKLTLPDNLTTWRIDARAVTIGTLDKQMIVGQNTADFISTKPVLIRPVTPRFMVVGDELNFGAVVNNNTSEDQEVVVTLEGSGFLLMDGNQRNQTFIIPANSRQRVDWGIRVLDVPAIDVFFAVQSTDGRFSDASRSPVGLGDDRILPVYKYVAREIVGTSGTIQGTEAAIRTEAIILPEGIDTTQGELTVKVDRSLAGPMLDGLDYLQNYPHQCIEQTVSRFLPNVMTMRALAALNQSNPELEKNLREQVSFGLQRLYTNQKRDGGWGWFPRDEANPLTTAYALIGLVEARNSGFAVDQETILAAQDFLTDYLLREQERTDSLQPWQLNRRAFVLYALTRSGKPNSPMLSVLFIRREALNLDARAYLSMSLMAVDPNDPRIDTLMSDFTNTVKISATGAHWEESWRDYWNWSTDTRTTSLILMAMTHHDLSQAILPGVVRWLMVARKAEYWETTQETAWAVMALTDWMVATRELEPDYEFTVALNGEAEVSGVATAETALETTELQIAVADLLLDEANNISFSRTEGDGNLYYTAHLRSYIAVPSIEPVSRGIAIERVYYLANDETRTPITRARVGDQIEVTLNIVVTQGLHYVIIEDPIPAGTEAVDPRLQTSSIVGSPPSLSRNNPFGRGWGWWWFSQTELRDEKVVLYATYLPPGNYTFVYRLRVGIAGQYNVIPATGYEFYFPEVYGRSAGLLFTIEPRAEEN